MTLTFSKFAFVVMRWEIFPLLVMRAPSRVFRDEIDRIREVRPWDRQTLGGGTFGHLPSHSLRDQWRPHSTLLKIQLSWREQLAILRAKASCWKPSAWSSAQSTISKCYVKWAIQMALRTILAIWMVEEVRAALYPSPFSLRLLDHDEESHDRDRIRGMLMVTDASKRDAG